ncbi:MAG: acetyl-CoA acetyltransferase [Deltaproteobacteria bacterium]|nr:acetyl-CoA acetyltransferase [Deltaproteobacteria bacterium]
MTDCFIYDAVRTPRGKGRKKDGALADAPPLRMAKAVLQALPERGGFDSKEIEDVIFGCVEPVGEQGANVGRMAAMLSGYDDSVPGVQLNRFCASGLEAVNIGAAKVKAGDVDLIVGGGMESMSRLSMGASGGAWSADPELAWGTSFVPQGIGADLIATKHGYSRHDVDAFAVESQKRGAAAWEGGYFSKSIVPVKDAVGVTMLDRDEHMRPGTTVEDLAQLKPSFEMMGQNFGFNAVAIQKHPDVEQISHVHHAGNSSGIVDGSAAVLLGSKEAGERLGLKPRARIVKSATVGSEPCIMLTGPGPASRKVLGKAGMQTSDIDLWVTNVNGGAIAFGHPLGATGAMLIGTMLDELERRDLNTALITLCVGAGMGTSTIIERV